MTVNMGTNTIIVLDKAVACCARRINLRPDLRAVSSLGLNRVTEPARPGCHDASLAYLGPEARLDHVCK